MAEPLAVTERTGFGLATVMARNGVDAAAVGRAIGMTPPDGPRRVVAGSVALIGTGPGVWLAHGETAASDFAQRLADALRGIASVSDQSGGSVILRIAGEEARLLLQRGAAIDLHPDVFTPGSVATTMIAHIGVIIWQLDDRPSYEIALSRSFANSFRHWIDTTTAAL